MSELVDSLLPILGLLVVVIIIAITFGLAWALFKARYKEQLESRETTPVNFALPSRSVHLLAVDRTPDGAWKIAVNGRYYANLEAVPDDAVRQNVVTGLKEIAAFARNYVQKEPIARKSSAPAEPLGPVDEPTAHVGAAPTWLAPDSRISSAEKPMLSASPAVPSTAASPVGKLRGLFKGEPVLKRPEGAPTIMPTLDLAHEIGEIVVEMQAQIPSLAQRSIKLQNVPSGGVQFAIDGLTYFDVNEIPDADVQALIRAATKEWERR